MLRAAMTAERRRAAERRSPRRRARGRARVLVADDDAPTRELIAATLRASGYEVETAADGQEAVERVARAGSTSSSSTR